MEENNIPAGNICKNCVHCLRHLDAWCESFKVTQSDEETGDYEVAFNIMGGSWCDLAQCNMRAVKACERFEEKNEK